MRSKEGIVIRYALNTCKFIWLPTEQKIIATIKITFEKGKSINVKNKDSNVESETIIKYILQDSVAESNDNKSW